MRASQFIAYINADSNDIKVHRRSGIDRSGQRLKWQTVSVKGRELTGFELTDKLKEVRKQYRKNLTNNN